MKATTATFTNETMKQFVHELGADNLLTTAIGCRVGGIPPVGCAPVLLSSFPGSTVQEMANALTTAWAGIIDVPTLSQSLQACSFPPAAVTTAVQQAISLNFLQNALYNDANSLNKALAFYQGDLTKMKSGEKLDYLIISCLPNDYAPSSGSMLAALNAIGVSVAQLAQHKAADYRAANYCWVSQPISNQPFDRIICFEPTQSGDGAANQVSGIFSSLQQFAGAAAQNIIVGSSLVSTGSRGASPSAIFTALYKGANVMLPTTFSTMCFKIVNYNNSWTNTLNQLFTQLKQG